MNFEVFTPWSSLAGGLLIGLSAALLLVMNGRIAGISGIYGAAVSGTDSSPWRWAFVAGLLLAGLALVPFVPQLFVVDVPRELWMVAVAGLLVGVGTRYGSGCTSGHGVCGMGRLSPRSIVATLTFTATGAATVLILRSMA